MYCLLRLKIHEGTALVYSAFLHALDTTSNLLDLSQAAPGHIRLVDCKSVVEHGFLRIVEFADFPTIAYAAISYPWRGVSINPSDTMDSAFSVRGAEHADPVGVDALRSAWAAALHLSCAYLWVDRLSIVQKNKEDKTWQIRNMYNVYLSCRVCIVLAGGLRRVVRLDEETPWIHRSWTLQEVLAPRSTVVLIRWKLGPGHASSGGISTPVSVEEAVPGASAYIPLPLVLQVCTTVVGSQVACADIEAAKSWEAFLRKRQLEEILAAFVSVLGLGYLHELYGEYLEVWEGERK